MALKQLVLRKKLEAATAEAAQHRSKRTALDERRTALQTREQAAEAALNELTADSTQEERAVVETEAAAIETEQAALDKEFADHDAEQTRLDGIVSGLETDVQQLDERSAPPSETNTSALPEQRSRKEPVMENRTKYYDMTHEQRSAFFAREDVHGFLESVRTIKTRSLTNGTLTIPDIMIEILRDSLTKFSKLVKYVTLKSVSGTARQNIMGVAPEGVWMEAVGELNELDMKLNQIEVDGYMVGGIIWVPNALLEDSDVALGSEIMDQLGKAIGNGVDRAILFGTGTKMPLGIVTRLAQTSAPSSWGTYAPAWTDLHSTNVIKLNINGTTGATFYASLIASLGVANPLYSNGGVFWAMNRKTHINLMAKALAFDAAAALLAGVNNQMPIVGGDIVELEILGDNEIVGGFGSLYLLAERAGARVESSEHARFQQMQTGFRGYARYDGMPVFGEGFVAVSFDNTDAATTSTFPTDYANTELGVLGVTAAAGTNTGDTVLTVTGTEQSGTTLKFRIGDYRVATGDKPVGYTALVSGTTQVTCAAGKTITVVELDDSGRVIKSGKVVAVPKA